MEISAASDPEPVAREHGAPPQNAGAFFQWSRPARCLPKLPQCAFFQPRRHYHSMLCCWRYHIKMCMANGQIGRHRASCSTSKSLTTECLTQQTNVGNQYASVDRRAVIATCACTVRKNGHVHFHYTLPLRKPSSTTPMRFVRSEQVGISSSMHGFGSCGRRAFRHRRAKGQCSRST